MDFDSILSTEIANGVTIGDLFTVEFLAALLGDVVLAIVLLVAAFVVAGWVRRRIARLAEAHRQLDQTLFGFLANIARYVILAFAVLFILNTFGVRTTSLVAAIGAAGVAIGLALQGTLSNLAAGIMIIIFRPIKVGDFVEVAGEMGTVKSITLNMTELASLGNVQILIPNSEVWGNEIKNYSAYPTRRAEWTFGVSYDSNLAEAERIIRETLIADRRTHSDPEPFVQVNSLGDSSVDFLVRAWVDSGEYFAYQADMTRAMKEAFDAGGIGIPFPTRTVVHDNAPIRVAAPSAAE
ncbi:Small-conductance mechanosensitive channel [Roseibacterium elongatum DSM 19469]|uniref:Small-conductance mechanosensitive channel n=1 Tax=Roseicyclus elongatus DSM 19469 TaxID=1294273 RepID=W8RRJ4_9RHOB|nr:mechanosensitive ion channel family protein [Roseibacterium elongatum]AHM03799.1 Small-conductance mechanosensitive channel [Roseibacterium elongatum DSM 19469]